MFNKPKFKYHFHVEVVEPDTVYLLSEKGNTALIGRFYTQLAPLLNGSYTVDEIFQHLQSEASFFAVYHAILRLESQGYLTETENNLPPQESAFWNLQGRESTEVINKLTNAKVAVTTFGEVKKNAFISALESLKINVSEKGDFTVVLTDDYLQIGLDEFNRQAEVTKKPWLLVKPVGAVIWVGPLFVPGKTGCWECLAKRLRGNREVETSVGQQKGMISTFPTSRAILPTSLQMGVNWAATETAKWIVAGEHQQLEGKVFTFDITSLSIEQHTLVKRPQCGVCGVSSPQQKPQPLILQSHKKQFTADGGHRCLSPQETLKKYEHHISPITGLVKALPKLESDSSLIHVYAATHQFNRKFNSLNSLRQGLGHQSAGKGKTDIQSKASGFCEAVERYSGIFTEDKYRIKGTYTQLKSEAIHPNSCMHYSANQYQKREAWNSQHGHFAWVAEPFDEDKEIEWTPVWSLTTQTFKYLPTAFCYYGYPLDKSYRFCVGNSNGNAAGNTLEEAILQGFMELVERDCVALWWYNRVRQPALDLDSFNEPYLQALRDYYQTKNYELWVLDITNDLNIPSFAAIARRTDKPEEEIMLGYGTHFDPIIAINRAVTELNQMFAMLSKHDTTNNFDDPDKEYWFKNATLENQPYLAPDTNASLKMRSDYHQYCCEDDLKQDVLKCVEIAAKHSMETLVINQTCPDIGLSVVKVIVPEMRHFWPRFASGRLYDVPVQMGWLSAPLKEEELNPIPMFF